MRRIMAEQHSGYRFSIREIRTMLTYFEVNEDYKKDKEHVEIKAEIALTSDFDKRKKALSLTLGVRLTEDDTPFRFEVRQRGVFKLEKVPDEKTIETLATVNCPAILFPYVRETVAELTRRAGFSPLHLSPVNFVALAQGKRNKSLDKAK
jgi:preprotein translocase subunit SecB